VSQGSGLPGPEGAGSVIAEVPANDPPKQTVSGSGGRGGPGTGRFCVGDGAAFSAASRRLTAGTKKQKPSWEEF